MNYALIENGIVTNIIWLHPYNAADFPQAIPIDDTPVWIGDAYEDGVFYRDGERLLSPLQETGLILNNLLGGVNDVQYE